jgi:hypothetical protein
MLPHIDTHSKRWVLLEAKEPRPGVFGASAYAGKEKHPPSLIIGLISMNTRIVVSVVSLWLASTSATFGQFAFDVETGGVFPGYNDVRIPGKGGTSFSLTSELKTESSMFVRGRVLYFFGSRNTLSVLVAPLMVKARGTIPKVVQFQDKTFGANTPLNAEWKFNSYRLTYRYDIAKSEQIEFGLGLTAKIRDAKISLSGGDASSTKTDLGFVPLINFRFLWNPGSTVGLLVEADALAAPQGRAEDVLAAVVLRLSDSYTMRAGYRILEGGADNDTVYNFALLHYVAFGVTVTL